MNPAIAELYKATLLRHSKNAAKQRALPDATRTHKQRNPLCGDEITVSVKLDDAIVSCLVYDARCCSICAASASMLAEIAPGLSAVALQQAATSLIDYLKRPQSADTPTPETLPGDLAALEGVRQFPSRIRCATLPFEALLSALRAERVNCDE